MPVEQLTRAIALIKSGQKESARLILTQLVKADPGNETAWLWLAESMPDDNRRIAVLEAGLRVNPQNIRLQQGLARLREQHEPGTTPPLPPELPAVDDFNSLRQELIREPESPKIQRLHRQESQLEIHDRYGAETNIREPAAPIPSVGSQVRRKVGGVIKRITLPRRQILVRGLILLVLGLLAAAALGFTGFIMRDQLRGWLGLAGAELTPTIDVRTLTPGRENIANATPPGPTATITPTPTITPIPTPKSTVSFSFSYAVIAPENGAQVVQVGDIASVSTRCLAISADNRKLAAGMDDGTVLVWNLVAGDILYTLQGHIQPVNSVAFSPDGRYLVSGSDDTTVRVWNLSAGIEVSALFKHTNSVKSVAFSPDGRTFASGGLDGGLYLWQIGVNTAYSTLPVDGPVTSLDISQDGRLLVSGLANGVVKVWEIASGSLLKTMQGHSEAVNSVEFAPSGHKLVTGSADKAVKLWDVDSGKVLYTIGTHTDAVLSVSMSPDGRMVASASLGQTIKLWDVAEHREIALLRHIRNMPAVAFSQDGRVLAVALSPTDPDSNEGGVAFWGVRFGSETTPLVETITLNALQMGKWLPGARMATPHVAHQAVPVAGGRVLIIGGGVSDDPASFTAKAELYNPASGSSLFTGAMHISRGSFSATLLMDGRVLVIGGYNTNQQGEASAEIYDPISAGWNLTQPLFNHGTGHTATLLADGRVLVVGGRAEDSTGGISQRVELYDPNMNTWTETMSLSTPRCEHTAIRLANGNILVVGGIDSQGEYLNDATVYNPMTGKWTSVSGLNTARGEAKAILLEDGRVMISGGLTSIDGNTVTLNTVELYNPRSDGWEHTGSMTQSRYGHTINLLPGGLVVVIGGIKVEDHQNVYLDSVEVYDPQEGNWTPINSLDTARAYHTTTFLIDGRLLVMGGMSAVSEYMASTVTLKPINIPPTPLPTLEGTPGVMLPVSKIAFVSELEANSDIYTINPDGTDLVRLTDNASNKAPAWSPDGRQIVFSSNRDSITNYDLYLMNADGTGVTRLTTDLANETDPVWSPDGKWIAYAASVANNYDLFLISVDGIEQRRLTNLVGTVGSIDWSPDGQWLVFHVFSGTESAVYVINFDGTGQKQLTDLLLHAQSPAWSPDGQSIAFSAQMSVSYDLCLMKADGSEPHILVPNLDGREWDPGWSPDGTRLVFSLENADTKGIYIVNADSTNLVGPLDLPGSGSSPAWSPIIVEASPIPPVEAGSTITTTPGIEATPTLTTPVGSILPGVLMHENVSQLVDIYHSLDTSINEIDAVTFLLPDRLLAARISDDTWFWIDETGWLG